MCGHQLRNLGCSLVSLTALGLFVPLSGLGFAQSRPAADAAIAPEADALLKKMGACLAGAKQFAFSACDMMDQFLSDGQRVQVSINHRFMVRRPNAVAAEAQGDLEHARYVYDGKNLTLVDRTENLYAVLVVPDTLDAMLDFVAAEFALTMPLSDLFFSDPYAAVRPRIRSAKYIGLHQVRGVKCHHLAIRQESVDWQIWVQAADPPVPRKLVITYKELPGQPQYLAFLDDWNLAAEAPDGAFTFTPPPGARKTELTPGRKQLAPSTQPAAGEKR
ncbi:MAG: DUF2092 domain-containing protein [Planctomycetota bacterium]